MGKEDAARNYGHWGRRRERVGRAWYDYPMTCLEVTPILQNPKIPQRGTTIKQTVGGHARVRLRCSALDAGGRFGDVPCLPIDSCNRPPQVAVACTYMGNVEIMKNLTVLYSRFRTRFRTRATVTGVLRHGHGCARSGPSIPVTGNDFKFQDRDWRGITSELNFIHTYCEKDGVGYK